MNDRLISAPRGAGRHANVTVLGDTPLTVDADKIKDIPVWGTVHEGRVLPAARS